MPVPSLRLTVGNRESASRARHIVKQRGKQLQQTYRDTGSTLSTDRIEDGNKTYQDTGYSSSKSKETKKEKQCKKKKKTKWERDRITTVPVQQPSEGDESDGSDSESVQ